MFEPTMLCADFERARSRCFCNRSPSPRPSGRGIEGENSLNPSSRFASLNPLTRRDATLSPAGGEGRVRGRSGGGEVQGENSPKVLSRFAPPNRADESFGVPALAGSPDDLRRSPDRLKPELQTREVRGEAECARTFKSDDVFLDVNR
jgi:hypothetical protein